MAPAPENVKKVVSDVLYNKSRCTGMFKAPRTLMDFLAKNKEEAHKDFRFLQNRFSLRPKDMAGIVERKFAQFIQQGDNIVYLTFEAHKRKVFRFLSSSLFFYVMVVPARFHSEKARRFSFDERGSFILLAFEMKSKWEDLLGFVNYIQDGKNQREVRGILDRLYNDLNVFTEHGHSFYLIDHFKALTNYDVLVEVPPELQEQLKESSGDK
ncbi:hypothetical protein HYV84_01160 [Candidatus Woesearchaeota archaeon]|nr:hypothetical protein [Candidatus Woesearchaeota archaeon]